MIPVTGLKKGTTFQMDSQPYKVIDYSHVKMGRGNAIIRVAARNLRNGAVEEKTFTSGASIEPITTIKRKLQYLYRDGSNAVFMDPTTYEQLEVGNNILGHDLKFLNEGQVIEVLFWSQADRELPLGVELPPNVILAVSEAAPGVKGNSATNIYKDVKLENGLDARAPLFIKVGDKIKVDTRSGEYIERVK
ncbi:MAG: elongation factor P [Candidatus Blackburnbacteria bacterium RIFCSPHIGHO2_02_FULL_39_13]|uniref:Elongation factor P n=1 Tax=Candidatus Blackburnbacteria bacterium RIFCSPLOWO2_01_FULL_40_20 TaxID=1797519 RepID=A0A1G1VFU1_9BACT|nr:MAG: Elongation factor P [Microgenomates group bacterium GW2011_GWA2_39_19]OGY07297.1 MAG: elongation factor P [Candidatus Blackburnbacteria bacterium RIFCSPHIGHO2_01_FULL_40_17]OGY08057.1 MAG: elongation factor P [Candidatus Blackburnbacteria bacterium RIFCSPHIGHO2_02_FULL_39_13]OGY14146.1 MAG: elongation factor P [Candidatus Blackburnbacteria bacterium RIFCSPLOWO2_01_FULL_40_20]OGY15442.1 MAG: elongation factor P [Candidatus Blackburnbacteria bacterium RIFCSPLOWO2_02_FULL_40_10]HBL52144.1